MRHIIETTTLLRSLRYRLVLNLCDRYGIVSVSITIYFITAHGHSEVDRANIGEIHLQASDDIEYEPIGDEKYGITISDDEAPGPSGQSSSSKAPTNMFLRTVGKGSSRSSTSKTVVGQRRGHTRATSSRFLFLFR